MAKKQKTKKSPMKAYALLLSGDGGVATIIIQARSKKQALLGIKKYLAEDWEMNLSVKSLKLINEELERIFEIKYKDIKIFVASETENVPIDMYDLDENY